MAYRQKGKWWYGDSQADIRVELARFGKLNEYIPTEFADAKCSCGGRLFHLHMDEEQGAAERICTSCGAEHLMGDSDEYVADASLRACDCVCGKDVFEITVGVSLYEGSEDVRWLYVGCRCPGCGLTGCYGDWKNEFIGFRDLLNRI